MNNKIDKVPEEFKQLAEDFSKNGFITTSLDNLINWSRSGSLHWMTFGLACCAVEMSCLHHLYCTTSKSKGHPMK